VGYHDRPLYLRFVDGPLTGTEVRAWRREGRPRLRSASRFAPWTCSPAWSMCCSGCRCSCGGGCRAVVAGADRLARAHLDAGGCPYYGRVVREGGDTVCQYWFVCPFNDWRSTFHGVNDHEADWEPSPSSSSPTTAGCARPGRRPRTTTTARHSGGAGTTPESAGRATIPWCGSRRV
jgi:hypothetical protein